MIKSLALLLKRGICGKVGAPLLFAAVLLIFGISVPAQNKYQQDFDEFWNDINQNYAYLDRQGIDWKKVKEIYKPKVEKISNNYEFIEFLESVLNELYNGHSSLNTNLKSSNKLIPSGQDLFVEKKGEKYYITDVRPGSGAELSGLKAGMEVVSFKNREIDEQLKKFLPKYTQPHNPAMHRYALDMLFAGTHDVKREIIVSSNGKTAKFFPDDFAAHSPTRLLESRIINQTTAYIKINNSLGDVNLIKEFDAALDGFMNRRNLVIDLTVTPSGGNTTVARAIMGRFVNRQLPYQVHEFDEKEYQTKRHWVEYVTPRKSIYPGKVYILVGHWTGSMGEGMAIGFDGMKRAEIIGTKMAGLLGAISNFQMPGTKIGYQFPTERLYHINGTPREDFRPKVLTGNAEETYQRMNMIK